MSFQEAFFNHQCAIAEGLNNVKGLRVDMTIVETNIVSASIYLGMQRLLLLLFVYNCLFNDFVVKLGLRQAVERLILR